MGKFRQYISNKIIALLPEAVIREINRRFSMDKKFFYSQEGEDVVLCRIFEFKENGFFIDIGAHHPTRFSNTYALYSRGWKGINVDATPGSMDIFRDLRPHDINLEMGVGDREGELNYFLFDEPALNTFSKERKDYLLENTKFRVINEVVVKVKTVTQILDTYLPPAQMIDFMTIDVEGLDLEILRSNDWSKYRPYIVLVEDLGESLERFSTSESYKFLNDKNYELIAKTFNTMFFRDKIHALTIPINK